MTHGLKIRTGECGSCGAVIAADLRFCPYCAAQMPDMNLLPRDVTSFIEEKIAPLDGYISMGLPGYIVTVSRALPVLAVPIAASAGIMLITGSWIYALIFFGCAMSMSFIAFHSFYEYYHFSAFFMRWHWKRRIKPVIVRYLEQKGFPENSYYGVALDYLAAQKSPANSDALVIFDE